MHCPHYTPVTNQTTVRRGSSHILPIQGLISQKQTLTGGSQEGKGRSQLRIQSLEKWHRGQLQLWALNFSTLHGQQGNWVFALSSPSTGQKPLGERNSRELPSAADQGESPREEPEWEHPTGVGALENGHCLPPFPDRNISYSTEATDGPRNAGARFQSCLLFWLFTPPPRSHSFKVYLPICISPVSPAKRAVWWIWAKGH